MSQPTSLGELIRERRLAHGMSLSQFAGRIDHSAAEVRSWERGESEPALDSRDALVDVLDVDPEVLDAVWPLPGSEPAPAEAEPVPPDELDDTFLAVGGVVAGMAVGDEPASAEPATDETPASAVLMEEPTEAIGAPYVVTAPVPTETAMLTLVEPETPRRWNPIREIYDPNKPWLTYIRTVLTIAVLVVLGLILFRLLGELFDALGELLDTVGTDEDAGSTLEALGSLSWIRWG